MALAIATLSGHTTIIAAIRKFTALAIVDLTLTCVAIISLFTPAAIADDSRATPSPKPVPAVAFSNFDNALMLAVARAGERLVAVGEHGLVLISDDEGNSWRQALTGVVDTTLAAVTFVDVTHGWIVGREEVILHTDDGGESWQLQHWNPLPESGMEGVLLEVLFTTPLRGFAVGANGTLLSTHDAGESWQRTTLLDSEGFEPHLFDINGDSDSGAFISGEQGSLWRSTDNGATWEQITTPFAGSIFGVVTVGSRGVLIYAMLGKAFYSPDSGNSWRALETGSRHAWMNAREWPPGKALLAGYRGTVGLFDAATETITLLQQNHRKAIADLIPLSKKRLLLVGQGGAWRTTISREPIPANESANAGEVR